MFGPADENMRDEIGCMLRVWKADELIADRERNAQALCLASEVLMRPRSRADVDKDALLAQVRAAAKAWSIAQVTLTRTETEILERFGEPGRIKALQQEIRTARQKGEDDGDDEVQRRQEEEAEGKRAR